MRPDPEPDRLDVAGLPVAGRDDALGAVLKRLVAVAVDRDN
jgi:hypothetical protein